MKPNERKTRERDTRKNEILDAAQSVFFDKNFDEATMDEIALKSEFTKKTLYSYFQSKEDLYASLVLKALKLLIYNFEQASDKGSTGFEKVANVGQSYFSFFKDHPVEFRLLASKIIIKEKSSLSEEIKIENEKMYRIVCSAFEHGIMDSSIKKETNPLKAALYVITISRGMLELISQDVENFETLYGIKLQEFLDYSLFMMGASFKN